MMNRALNILVSSIVPWNERTGSDTLPLLLSQFDRTNIASINIRAQKSDSSVAGSYFHIIESRVIKSIIRPCIITGEAYQPAAGGDHESKESKDERRFYGKRHFGNRWLYVYIRELLWWLGHWKSPQLDEYITGFKPDAFFFPIESCIHFNRINQYIIDKFHPSKVVGYMWDDNFTFKQKPFNPLYLLHRLLLRRGVKRIIHSCDTVFVITPKMKQELDSAYRIDSVLLTKPIRLSESFNLYQPGNPIRILYTGKLIIGREAIISAVADAIRRINSNGVKVLLDVYTGTALSRRSIKSIEDSGYCMIHGFTPQSTILEIQKKADILLFVESFSSRDMTARLSFSTKITDYFSVGKCIWAIGNKELAPIDYLCREDAALVSTSRESIWTVINDIVNDPSIVSRYAKKAYECGISNHSLASMQSKLLNALQ